MPFLGRTLCRGPTKTPSANQDTSLCHSPNIFASPQGPGWNVQGVFRGGRPGVQVCVQDDIDVKHNISKISADLTNLSIFSRLGSARAAGEPIMKSATWISY